MIKRFALLITLALAFNVKAEDKANPIAYVDNAEGEWIVLTDYWRKELCPPGAYVAYSRSNNQELTGCWIADDTDVILMWLPHYTIVKVPRESFLRFDQVMYD